MTFVLTLDQRASRAGRDRVPDLLGDLNAEPLSLPLVRAFERTAGDEVQGVVETAAGVTDILAVLLRTGQWNIGIGIGAVESPLPSSTRAGRGAAFLHAREAVTAAKTAPHHVCVVGADPYRAEQVETAVWLWAGLLERRSERGWEVADLLDTGVSGVEAAQRLGISPSAVTQRAKAAHVLDAQRAQRLARQLMDESGSR
jgi:hypothetical protein